MSPPSDDQHGLNHNQQYFSHYDDRVTMSHSSQATTYSSSSRGPATTSSDLFLPPSMPQIGFAQDLHAQAMAHHEAALRHGAAIHQSMFGQQPSFPTLTGYASQPALTYDTAPEGPRLIEMDDAYKSKSNSSRASSVRSSSSYDGDAEHRRQIEANERQRDIEERQRLRRVEERHAAEVRAMQRKAEEAQDRMALSKKVVHATARNAKQMLGRRRCYADIMRSLCAGGRMTSSATYKS